MFYISGLHGLHFHHKYAHIIFQKVNIHYPPNMHVSVYQMLILRKALPMY